MHNWPNRLAVACLRRRSVSGTGDLVWAIVGARSDLRAAVASANQPSDRVDCARWHLLRGFGGAWLVT